MGLDKAEIKKIADLAKLELSDSELETYQEQLASVLNYVNKINELDLKSVKESLSGTEDTLVGPRPDELKASKPETIKSAHSIKDSLVVAPNVFDKK